MKKKVKGFTLIELIVVMATFSIIMFGAMQLLQPVGKMMTLSETQENGNAAISSISNYLDLNLSSSQYMLVSNTVPTIAADGAYSFADDGTPENLVREFTDYYCNGIIKLQSSADAPTYAPADVHMIVIDNDYASYVDKDGDGKHDGFTFTPGKSLISEYTFHYDPSSGITKTAENLQPINKAYLDTNMFQIKAGTYTDNTAFEAAVTDAADAAMSGGVSGFMSNFSSRTTTLTIQSSTYKHHTWYNYLTTSAMSLVNIYNADSLSNYYVIGINGSTGQPEIQKRTIASSMRYHYDTDPATHGNGNGYCFVYCYNSDINIF